MLSLFSKMWIISGFGMFTFNYYLIFSMFILSSTDCGICLYSEWKEQPLSQTWTFCTLFEPVFWSSFSTSRGLPRWLPGEESASSAGDAGDAGLILWVGKIPWKRAWQPNPGFLPGESHGQRSLAGHSPWGHRVGHDWATSLSLLTFLHWRRKWQPTPVFLPGESQGRGSLVGCRLWGHTESDTTEAT